MNLFPLDFGNRKGKKIQVKCKKCCQSPAVLPTMHPVDSLLFFLSSPLGKSWPWLAFREKSHGARAKEQWYTRTHTGTRTRTHTRTHAHAHWVSGAWSGCVTLYRAFTSLCKQGKEFRRRRRVCTWVCISIRLCVHAVQCGGQRSDHMTALS